MITPVANTKPPRLRILCVGINYSPNQITRAVEKYGCDVVHIDGDPGDSFPRFCDAAIMVISYMGHSRYHAVKDFFKQSGRPYWLTGNGFSEVKEQFERYLQMKRGFVHPPTQIVGALEVPSTWLPPEKSPARQEPELIEPKIKAPEVRVAGQGFKFDPVTRAKIDAIVKQNYERLTYDLIAEKLNAAGYRKISGSPFNGTDVGGRVHRLRALGELHDPRAAKLKKPPRASEPTTVAAPMAPTHDRMDLIQKVTISTVLQPAEKIELIQRISLGEITQPESTDRVVVDGNLMIEQVSILRAKSENPHLTLTKAQAELILSNLDALDKFTKGQPL